MMIEEGALYILKDDFFTKFNDPYLMKNHGAARPVFLSISDPNNSKIIWVIPLSSQIEKYKKILLKNKSKSRRTKNDIFKISIQIVKIFNKEQVLLLQNLFPITEKYILKEFIEFKRGEHIKIKNLNLVNNIKIDTLAIIDYFRKGNIFFNTHAKIFLIENELLNEK